MSSSPIEEILTFWFGVPDKQMWFKADPAFDALITTTFGELVLPATAGALDGWATSPDGAAALLLVLDQFPRNMHRGTPQAFASDAKAREIARDVIAAGLDQLFPVARRSFLYLPFEHSERLADQELCCSLMATAEDQEALDYAELHYRVIQRFGRFPHRNAILGRHSTPDEATFLLEPGSSF